jgi:CheY-like chemotaxis protein
MPNLRKTTEGIVALFNASDDTTVMIQALLTEAGGAQSLVWCHFADLKNGIVDVTSFLRKHNPEVVIFKVCAPYDENWQFLKTVRDADEMRGRGCVLITPNKTHLDEMLGADSHALELLGKDEDLKRIGAAIAAETQGSRSRASSGHIASSTMPPQAPTRPASTHCAVALFNASDDTFEMVQRMLSAAGMNCLGGCHFADLKKGNIRFEEFLAKHDPQVVIFDISPPYEENWEFFKSLRKAMGTRGLVLTTTNKHRLDEVVGADSTAIEIVGKPYDIAEITAAITAALQRAVVADADAVVA